MRKVNQCNERYHPERAERESTFKELKFPFMNSQDPVISTLRQLLDRDICHCASAEVQLEKKLPEWISRASSIMLKASLQKYADFVSAHIGKLDGFIEKEQVSQLPLRNPIMQAFIRDAEDKLGHCSDTEIKDACLLSCVQQINHFKISAYGTAAAFARALGMEDQAAVFHEAEVNEKQIDDRLSQLAEHEINLKARTPVILPANDA